MPIGASVGDVFLRVRPDVSGFEAEASRRVMPGVGRLAAGIATAFATARLGDKLRDSIMGAADLGEAVNVVGITFKNAAPQIEAFAKGADAIGFTDEQALSLSASIGGLLKNLGFTEQATADWSKRLVSLGADLGSAFNVAPKEAVEAVGAAMRGEMEPIRRFNVMLDDESVRLEAVRLGLAKSTKEVSRNAKAQATLSLITQQTTDAQGDFARTATGLPNTLRRMRAQFGDITAEIGKRFLPFVERTANAITKNMRPAFERLTKVAATTNKALQPFFARLGAAIPVLVRGMRNFGRSLLTLFRRLRQGTREANPTIVRLRNVFWNLVIIGRILFRIFRRIAVAIYRDLEPRARRMATTFREQWLPVIERLVTQFRDFLHTLEANEDRMERLTDIAKKLGVAFASVLVVNRVLGTVRSMAGAVNLLGGAIRQAPVVQFARAIAGLTGKTISVVADIAQATFDEGAKKAKAAIDGIPKVVKVVAEVTQDAFDAVKKKLSELATGIVAKIKPELPERAGDDVKKSARNLGLSIAAEIGKAILLGFAINRPDAKGAMKALGVDKIGWRAAFTLPGGLITAATALAGYFVTTWIGENRKEVAKRSGEILQSISDALLQAPAAYQQAHQKMWDEIKRRVGEFEWGYLIDPEKLKEAVSAVWRVLGDAATWQIPLNVEDMVRGFTIKFGEFLEGTFGEEMRMTFEELDDQFVSYLEEMMNAIAPSIDQIGRDWYEVGVRWVDSLERGFLDAIADIGEFINRNILSRIPDSMRRLLGITGIDVEKGVPGVQTQRLPGSPGGPRADYPTQPATSVTAYDLRGATIEARDPQELFREMERLARHAALANGGGR